MFPCTPIVNTARRSRDEDPFHTLSDSNIAKVAGSWKEFAVFMQGDTHYPVSGVEGFFDTVAVMHIDVDVQHSCMEPEQFKDCEDDICTSALLVSRRNITLYGFTSVCLSMTCWTRIVEDDLPFI